ncbi:Ribose methyltransferase, partial [Rhizophlyctis rosea]
MARYSYYSSKLEQGEPTNTNAKSALDQIADPQNLGSILRTAHFFDIDGIVMTERESAPLSPTTSKSSAGALEHLSNIYTTPHLPKFLSQSSQNGWTIFGTDLNSDKTLSIES